MHIADIQEFCLSRMPMWCHGITWQNTDDVKKQLFSRKVTDHL